jgi:hypothetical protein
MTHRWSFFRSGGVDQVSLRDAADLAALATLDPKLWVALAMPVRGTDHPPETLALLDADGDGRIRAPDVLAAVDLVRGALTRPEEILTSADRVELAAIRDPKIAAAARRMLADLGKPIATAIGVEDVTAITAAFADTVLNGDGIVIPGSSDEPDLRRAIEDGIRCLGGVTDRSGAPGLDRAKAEQLWAAVDARAGWLAEDSAAHRRPLGAGTAAAAAALAAVRGKLEDYFTRCRVASFDPRGAAALGGQDAELVALSARALTGGDEQLARLPLARITAAVELRLGPGTNPAWAGAIAAFLEHAVVPILGPREVITPGDLAAIEAKLEPFLAHRAACPVTAVDSLDPAWIAQLAQPALRERLAALIRAEAELAAEYDQIASVTKVVRFRRDLGRVLRNFVNFSDFYGQQRGAFQAGTLYLDARAMHLCVEVTSPDQHAALAGASDAFLIYCDLARAGATKQIAAALTNGDADHVFVGRNGVFRDREGAVWDATVTKIVSNPVSIRQAFWTPYKKLVKTIEDGVAKRAADADAAATAKVEAAGSQVAHADQAAAPAKPPGKIDLGTVAAIGVAIGGIGTLVGALLSTMFGLGPWLPLGLLALLLMISGPAMLLAWLKLRRRNLGPILDANGWAINGRARVNVAFGAAMTELAKLPPGSARSLEDPFADRPTPWRRWVVLAVVVALAGAWLLGKLDRWLPERARAATVLEREATPPAPAPATPPAPAASPASAAK